MNQSSDRLDRIESAIERLIQVQTSIVQTQEQQQVRLDRHEQTTERILGHVSTLYESIQITQENIQSVQEDIKGLRTESLRIQRRIFGDEVE